MATSAYELLAAYVSVTSKGHVEVLNSIDRVKKASESVSAKTAKVSFDVPNISAVTSAITSVSARVDDVTQSVGEASDAMAGLAPPIDNAAEAMAKLAEKTKQVVVQAQAVARLDAQGRYRDSSGRYYRNLDPSVSFRPQATDPPGSNNEKITQESQLLNELTNRLSLAALGYQALANARTAAVTSFNAALVTEDDNASFEALIGNATKATAILQELHAFASDSVFSFPELRQAAIRMAAVGIPAEKLTQTLKAIATVSQATNADINNVIRQYTQAMGSATLRAEELQILVENNIPVYDLLSKSMGKNTDVVRQLGREGKLASDELEKAFLKAAESQSVLAKAAAALNETTKGAFKSILQNAIEIGEAFARWSLSGLTEELDGIRETMEVIAFLANKLSPSDKVVAEKKSPAFTSEGAARGFLATFHLGFISDGLTAIGILGKLADRVTSVAIAAKNASRTRVELAEGVTQAEMEGVEKVVEAQNKALADAESRFAQYWQRLRRTWQQEQESLFDDNLDALTRDTRTADALRQSLMSPMDEFKAKIAEAQQLLEQGLISDETFTGVFNRASKELDDIKRKVSSIQNVRTSFIVGQSGELSFRMQASRTQDLQLIEAKQQSKMDAERNRILNDIRNGLQQRQEQAKPEVSAETFPTELF